MALQNMGTNATLLCGLSTNNNCTHEPTSNNRIAVANATSEYALRIRSLFSMMGVSRPAIGCSFPAVPCATTTRAAHWNVLVPILECHACR